MCDTRSRPSPREGGGKTRIMISSGGQGGVLGLSCPCTSTARTTTSTYLRVGGSPWSEKQTLVTFLSDDGINRIGR
jgi:hypothetical protein